MGSEGLPMIGLTLMEDILMNPPPFLRLISVEPITWAHNPSLVTLCVSSFKEHFFSGSRGRVLKFDTEEEFEMIVQGLLSRPLFLHVDLTKYEGKTIQRSADFFVTVNTSHPIIKSQLVKSINEARTHVKEGRQMALEIDFNPLMDDWFHNVLEAPTDCEIPGLVATHAKIVITNTSEYCAFFRSCNPGLVMFSLLCLPLSMMSCMAYRLYRTMGTKDRVAEIQGEVKYLTWVNGVPRATTDMPLNWKPRTSLLYMGLPVGDI